MEKVYEYWIEASCHYGHVMRRCDLGEGTPEVVLLLRRGNIEFDQQEVQPDLVLHSPKCDEYDMTSFGLAARKDWQSENRSWIAGA